MLQVAGQTSVLLSVLPPSMILGPERKAFPEALKKAINNDVIGFYRETINKVTGDLKYPGG